MSYRIRVVLEQTDTGEQVCEPLVFPLDSDHRFLSLEEKPLRLDAERVCNGVHVHAWIAHAHPAAALERANDGAAS